MSNYPVEELWVDSAYVVPVDIDWSDKREYGEFNGWLSYEAPECPECGGYAVWNPERHAWVCDSDDNCTHAQETCDDDEVNGPMMNYYYPLPDLNRVSDVQEAASLINDLPLCVVEFDDGSYALALTGGGMDLSWEIAEAFTRLGFLPPLHYCDLPKLAGKKIEGSAAYTLAACVRTTQVVENRALRLREHLSSFTPA